MQRAVFTLLVGLMLSLSGVANASNVLPNASPEEQYEFALNRAMQNDLETAALAFAEFIEINKSHARGADALFWLGRIHYLLRDYTDAALRFSEFSRSFPYDERLDSTTLLIAQSVSHFAPAAQACAIFDQLPNILISPPEKFTDKLAAISEAKNCGLAPSLNGAIQNLAEKTICNIATTEDGFWETESFYLKYVDEAKRRNLICESAMPLSNKAKHKHNKPSSPSAQIDEVQQKAGSEHLLKPTKKRTDNHQTTSIAGGYSVADILEKNAVNSELENTLLLMMQRRDDEACRTVMDRVGQTLSPMWHKLKALCAAAQGDVAGTQFSLDVLQASGEQDPIFYGLMSTLLSDSKYKVPSSFSGMSKEQTLLYLTVMDAAHVDIDVGHLENLENRYLNVLLGLRYLTPEAREYTTCGNFADITDPELKYLEIGAEKARMFERSVKKGAFDCHAALSGFLDTVSTPNQVLNSATKAEQIVKEESLKRLELENELAALRAQQEQRQQTITNDNQIPLINIVSANTAGKQGVIEGYVTDNTGVAEVLVDGTVVPVSGDGNFEYRTFVPVNGISVQVEATDLAGLTSVMSVSLERSASTETASITFDRLNPLGKQVAENHDALALIVGVADYKNTPAKAIFADSDALMFRDYASEKLGIPENRIKTLVDDGADIREVLLGVKNWLARAVRQEQSDVYIFFAGHGLPSADGAEIYLLPYDGTPELPEETTISRKKLFADIAAANPRSVTVFLDTCYSGVTRGDDFLIAARPAFVRVAEQSIPDGFTVMTAAAGDQTAKPLEEAKHGMFSYFLMKGMEGDADANQDNQITAGELQEYVYQNVVQQSSGSQTPELQGDADRVLVRFQ